MPQELLRDVLRTDDAPARARRFSILPISIVAHAVVLAAVVIIPLAASVELPPIASMFNPEYIATVRPPAPPPPPTTSPPQQVQPGAPIAAPDHISESARTSTHAGPEVPGGIDVAPGGVPGEIGSTTGLAPVPPAPPLPPPPAPAKPVRVGSGIREPKKIVHVAPEYPEIARRAGVEGVVILEAVLDATGRVQSVRVLRSSPLLDEAAIGAVRQWRYTPTELNGIPVPVLMTIKVQFTLAR